MSLDRNNIDVPDYMNTDFFQKALRNGYKQDNIKVEKVFFTLGPKLGENYCSQIYRADATYNDGNSNSTTVSLIIKALPPSILGEYFKQIGMFLHESDIYAHALSEITSILHGEEIAPKFLYFIAEPRDTLVLVDVTPQGYVLADRVRALDEDHIALIFRKLAKCHAASMVLAQKKPEVFTRFSKNVMEQNHSEELDRSMHQNFNYFADVVSSWPGFESTAEKIRKFIPKIREIFQKSGQRDEEIKVLAHNDLWTNNILFKYENGKAVDLYFVDFQMTQYTSPGIDITHFLYTSVQYEILEKKRDSLVKEYYYKTFRKTLEDLGYKAIPTLADIIGEIEKREDMGFIWAVTKLFLICMDPSKCDNNSLDNLNDLEQGTRIRAIGMSSERFIITMKYVLRRMEKLGVLD